MCRGVSGAQAAGEQSCRAARGLCAWAQPGFGCRSRTSLLFGNSWAMCNASQATAQWQNVHNTFGNLAKMNTEPKLELLTVRHREQQQDARNAIADLSLPWHYFGTKFLTPFSSDVFHSVENNRVSKQQARTESLFTVAEEFLGLAKQRKWRVCIGAKKRTPVLPVVSPSK